MIAAGFILTITNFLTGILGYVYQILMGRNLSPVEFAAFSAIMAAFMFASSPFGALLMIFSRRVTELAVFGEKEKLNTLLSKSYIIFILIAIILTVASYGFVDIVGSFFKIENTLIVYVFLLLLFVNVFFVINNSFLQGLKKFYYLAASAFISVLLKIVFSLFFVTIGLGVLGALGGGVVSLAVIVILGFFLVKRCVDKIDKVNAQHNNEGWLSFKSLIPVLVANIAFAAMTQLDMVIVNYLFTTENAGDYAAASVLGKAILYIPGGIVLALYPFVAEKHANKLSSNLILVQSLSAAFVLCSCAALFYWFFSESLIVFLYGDAYAEASKLLPLYGLAIMPMALVLVVEHYLIAKKEVLFTWLFLFFAPIQVLLLYYFSTDLVSVILIFGFSGLVLLILGLLLLVRKNSRVAV